MASPWEGLEAQLVALRETRPANVVLGWELPHDPQADHELKARRYERHRGGCARHGAERPDCLASAAHADEMHALVELVLLPGGRTAHHWIAIRELEGDPAAVVEALQQTLLAARRPLTVHLPDGVVATST